MKNGNRSQDEGFDLVRRWKSSGLTAAEFAGLEGVTHHTVHYWAGRFRRNQAPQASPLNPGLIEIRTLPSTSLHPVGVSILFKNGVRVELGTCHDLVTLLHLVAQL